MSAFGVTSAPFAIATRTAASRSTSIGIGQLDVQQAPA
jgi:hypothetical protein